MAVSHAATAQPAPGAINIKPPQSAPSSGHPALVTDILVDHGPPDVLGRFFLKADTAARNRGITMSFGTFEDLWQVNQKNLNSWRNLISQYDYRACPQGLAPERAFCLIGRNEQGEIVATQGARLFTLEDETLHDIATSMRLLYDNPERDKLPDERCEVTADIARTIRGRLLINGAVWYHPAYRKRQLSMIMPRVARAYALTHWAIDHSMGLVMEGPTRGGVIDSLGYPHREWDLKYINSSLGIPVGRCCLAWMHADELLADLRDWLSGFDAEVDAGVDDRRAQQQG